jgi:alpha-L-fucosidase
MGWPESGSVNIQSLAAGDPRYPKTVGKVELLGAEGPLQFTRDQTRLNVKLPANKPNDYAYAFKITPL